MSDKSNIPRSIKTFAVYIAQTCAYLVLGVPTNAVRFNWTAGNLSQWQLFFSQWTPLFNLYTNKKGGYTTSVKIKLEGIIANVIIYAENNKLIELVRATVSLNSDDCITFNLPTSLVIPAYRRSSCDLKPKSWIRLFLPSKGFILNFYPN